MKKYLLLIIISYFNYHIFAQGFPLDEYGNPDYVQWDWENQNSNNWKQKLENGKWADIDPPFSVFTNKNAILKEIADNKDYTKENGWRLVNAYFSGSYPYFILYNEYSGLMRAFMYTGKNTDFDKISFTLIPTGDAASSKLFHFAEEKMVAVNDQDELNNFSQHQISSYSDVGINSWAVFEIPILFDNSIVNKNANWEYQFRKCTKFDIKMNILGSSVGLNSKGQALIAHPAPTTTEGKIDVKDKQNGSLKDGYTKVHTNIKNMSEWADKMKDYAGKLNKDSTGKPSFVKEYIKIVNNLNQAIKIAGVISQVSKGIEVATGIFDFIFGFGSSKSPTIYGYNHNLTATGEINLSTNLNFNTSAIPGSKDSRLLQWQYNCPMGIINLKETPVIKITNEYSSIKDISGRIDGNIIDRRKDLIIKNKKLYYIIPNDPYNGKISLNKYILNTIPNFGVFKQIKLENDIEFNIKNNIEIIDIKFAILCKETSEFINRFNNPTIIHLFPSIFVSLTVSQYNLVYEGLEKGRYIIHDYNPSEKRIVYGTPYLPSNQLKGISMEVSKNADISLGVMIQYKIKGKNENMFFKGTYKIKTVEESVNNPILLDNDQQTNFPLNEYWADSDIMLNSESSSPYVNYSITLKPGFIGKPGFSAKASYARTEIGETKYHYYDFNCQNDTRRSKYVFDDNLNDLSIDNKKIPFESQVLIYPNPNSGLFHINIDSNINYKIDIYNISGKLIYNNNTYSGEEINLTYYPKGVYLVRITIDKEVITKKIVVK